MSVCDKPVLPTGVGIGPSLHSPVQLELLASSLDRGVESIHFSLEHQRTYMLIEQVIFIFFHVYYYPVTNSLV